MVPSRTPDSAPASTDQSSPVGNSTRVAETPAGHEPAAATRRTPPKRKARQLAKHLRDERPDYTYLKAVFRALRVELGIEVDRQPKKLPYVPTEEEIRRYYQAVWQARRGGDVVLINTGGRVAELVAIRLVEVDLDACRIRITNGKGGKDRTVPFPPTFAETLALHVDARRKAGGYHLFRVRLEGALQHPWGARHARLMALT